MSRSLGNPSMQVLRSEQRSASRFTDSGHRFAQHMRRDCSSHNSHSAVTHTTDTTVAWWGCDHDLARHTEVWPLSKILYKQLDSEIGVEDSLPAAGQRAVQKTLSPQL